MLAEVTLTIEARREREIRILDVELGQDFFGAWVVSIRQGRAGSRGRRTVRSAPCLDTAWRLVLARMKRLKSSSHVLHVAAVPDISLPAWANAPLLPWRDLAG